MSDPVKVIIVEDNPEYRNVLKMAFEFDSGIELVGIYGSAEHALRALEPKSQKASQPDILLLDLNLPEMSGLDAMKWFKDYVPHAPIIALTQSDAESDVLTAIQNGATGYLLKSSTIPQIKNAIHTVASGGAQLDRKVARYILDQVNARPTADARSAVDTAKRKSQSASDTENSLSKRELEVLELLAEGLVKKEIADKLSISYFTVSAHIRHIYDKLDVLNAPAAVSVSYQSGILPIKKK